MNIVKGINGLGGNNIRTGDDARRSGGANGRLAGGVEHTLLRVLILGVETQSLAKLGQRFDLVAVEKVLIPVLQMRPGKVLTSHFGGGKVLRVLGSEPGSLLELIKRLLQVLGALKLKTALKGPVGGFAVFGGIWNGRRGHFSSQAESQQYHDKTQGTPRPKPSHINTIECPEADVLQGKYTEGNYDRNGGRRRRLARGRWLPTGGRILETNCGMVFAR